jgi:hypothetical protein
METTTMTLLHPHAAGHPALGLGQRSGSDGCVRHRDAVHGVSATEAAPLAEWLTARARAQGVGDAERRAIGARALAARTHARKHALRRVERSGSQFCRTRVLFVR